jgi:hypothetical protein
MKTLHPLAHPAAVVVLRTATKQTHYSDNKLNKNKKTNYMIILFKLAGKGTITKTAAIGTVYLPNQTYVHSQSQTYKIIC